MRRRRKRQDPGENERKNEEEKKEGMEMTKTVLFAKTTIASVTANKDHKDEIFIIIIVFITILSSIY